MSEVWVTRFLCDFSVPLYAPRLRRCADFFTAEVECQQIPLTKTPPLKGRSVVVSSIRSKPLARPTKPTGGAKRSNDPAGYTKDFVTNVAARFNIEIGQRNLARILGEIRRRYILANRIDFRDARSEDRLEYSRRLKIITKFKEKLRPWALHDMAADMAYAALVSSDHQRQRGDELVRELWGRLELAEQSAALTVQRLTSKGGRPINYGLEALTRRAADFWIETLKREFTIDHHQGSGLTEAFQFVRTLVLPTDAIPDLKIVTAMRAEIKSRRSSGTPTRRAGQSPAKRQS